MANKSLFMNRGRNIPHPVRSRGHLWYHINEFDDGASVLTISGEVYPELFSIKFPMIECLAPKGWSQKEGKRTKYLWFPAGRPSDSDKQKVEGWCKRWEGYVLLGKGGPIAPYFGNELDFCMALSMTRESPDTQIRFKYGEAEYQLKYGNQDSKHLTTLLDGLAIAYSDLPIVASQDDVLLSSVPSRSGNDLPGQLLTNLVPRLGVDMLRASLNCDKQQLKGLTFDRKIAEWKRIYGTAGAVTLDENVSEKTVVIIDDLYQSGATMWCYAEFLKQQGAKYVIGLAAVKSLRDSDNQ